jgi:hypothetical protein
MFHPKVENPEIPVRCIDCGEIYDAKGGGPMVNYCGDCFNKPAPPPAYVERNGLLIPNPAAQ